MSTSADILWVNTVRTFGIFLVYLYHCEFYFGANTYELSIWYIPFFMSIFFFVSGYLFFFPNKNINSQKKLASLCKKQLWPYFIFCSLIYIPKILIRGGSVSFGDFCNEILTGSASWFISALIVLQLVILFLYKWIKHPIIYMMGGGIICIIFSYLNPEGGKSFWYWKSALTALPFFAFGGIFHYYEESILKYLNLMTGVTCIVIYVIIYVQFGAYVNIGQAVCHSNLLGIIASLLGTTGIILVLYKLPQNRIISFVGKNTLPLYFISGGCPMLVTHIAKRFITIQTPIINICLTILSLVIGIAITLLIKARFKFLLDFSIVIDRLYKNK